MSAKALEEWRVLRPAMDQCWQEAKRKAPRSQRVEKYLECMRETLRNYYLP